MSNIYKGSIRFVVHADDYQMYFSFVPSSVFKTAARMIRQNFTQTEIV